MYEDLILYLKMARVKVKDVQIDNEVIYAYAKTNRLADLEDFLAASNVAKVQDVSDILFNEKLYQAARICYTHVGNNAKLAITLVRLELYAEAGGGGPQGQQHPDLEGGVLRLCGGARSSAWRSCRP